MAIQNAKQQPAMEAADWAQLGFLSVLWGGSFFFAKLALGELRPFTLVLSRVAIAALVLNIGVRAGGQRMPRGWRAWTPFFVMGLFNSLIPNSLIFWGQTQISASLASILNATTPLWTVILAHFFTTDERLTPNRLVGVLIGLLGVAVMIGPAALQGIGLNVLAQFAVITAAMSYAIATIYGKRLRATPPFIASAGQLTASTVLLIPFVVLVDRPWTLPSPSGSTIAAVLALALLSTALAYILYFRILRSSGATNIALVTFLIPVSAMILGTVLLNERLEPRDFVGMALIGTGLAAIDGRLIRRFLPARPPVETVPEEVAP